MTDDTGEQNNQKYSPPQDIAGQTNAPASEAKNQAVEPLVTRTVASGEKSYDLD